MSWWDVTGGVIGDRPADLMEDALSALAAERIAAGRALPSVQMLLAAVARELPGVDASTVRLIAHVEGGPDLSGAATDAVDADVAGVVREVLAEISDDYAPRWDRGPRASEIAALVDFVIGTAPERYLAAGEELHLRGIDVVPGELEGNNP